MTGSRLLAVFIGLATVTVVTVVVWLAFFRPVRTVERPVVTTPIVASPTTPLPRDSGPKNNARSVKRTTRRNGSSSAVAPRARPGQSRTPAARNRRSPVKTRKTPRRKANRPAQPQRPAQPSQPPSSTPPPQSSPPVTVTVPAPIAVCTPLAQINRCS